MAEVVLHVDPNPKRPGTGAHLRYQGYAIGRTRDDLIETGLSKRDIDWDEKQGHIKFGEGERSTAPISKPPPPSAPTPRASARTQAPPAPAEPEPYSGPPARTGTTSGHPDFPGVRAVMAPVSGAKGFAPWHLVPEQITVEALPGSSDRDWSFAAVVGKRRFVKTVPSDRLAMARVEAYLLHGIDPDDWEQVGEAA